ncbi:RNA 3'-terminal phosphate cyclase domain-containing protein [Chaetomidium leptoderma]|uniref:RNA 3'-terminal phosphate cyclase domain-containing protein n=1 Tax=Chaetomidium leptoderma TaxID=669021 RepID=A0AAN6ZY43_9PEZI|nr:RNA 3'-terminal phosphate cyclase domain-containing protein [Chaetomidium leptoderma]
MKDKLPIVELDGRTGEGGGQLVRIACALAAVATQPIRITSVRGNREGPRGGGLKSQHKTAIDYLATATAAEVSGVSIGSHTFEFRPQLRPSELKNRTITIAAESPAASTTLIFQAVFPFLLFAGNDKGEPVTLEISGGTNVSFSLSFEYLDQVLLPTLQDAFGITVERKLLARGWSLGRQQRGKVEFKFKPLRLGEPLRLKEKEAVVYGGDGPMPVVEDVEGIDVSMIIPAAMHESMREVLVGDLEQLFPDVEVDFKIVEDSGADSRIYVLLVAKAGTVRWGRDSLSSMPKKAKGKGGLQTASSLCATISRRISKELYEEVSTGGVVDEFLQDQLIVFQALAEGRSSFPRGEAKDSLEQAMGKLDIDGEGLRKEKTDKPFGEGSTHTTTARWVTAELLPRVKWYHKGNICEGVGMRMGKK